MTMKEKKTGQQLQQKGATSARHGFNESICFDGGSGMEMTQKKLSSRNITSVSKQ